MNDTSAFGYKTAAPLHRSGQQALRSREMRDRLMTTGVITKELNPLRTPASSASFVPEPQRLQTNAAQHLAEQHAARQQRTDARIAVKAARCAQRRAEHQEKVGEHWQRHETECKMLAGSSSRNKGSVGYDIVSGRFTSTSDADSQRVKDAALAHFVRNRTSRLEERTNSTQYNIISGARRPPVVIPPLPQLPAKQ